MPTPEQQSTPVTDGTTRTPESERFRTIAVRVEESLHAQLRFIAALSGSTISDEIRQAIEGRIAAAHDDPQLIARAEAARAEIEREAETRKAAIAGFMGQQATGSQRTGRTPKPSGR